MTTPIPNALPLNPDARLFMLTWLEADLSMGRTITPDSWRTAYGKAADHQTVTEARKVLAGVGVR